MIPNKNIKPYCYCVMLYCLLCLSSCSDLSIDSACDDTYPVSSSGNPAYLKLIWPSPGSVLYLSCYEDYLRDNTHPYRGIGAEVLVYKVDDYPSNPSTALLPERTELLLDNLLVSRQCLEIGNDLLDTFYWDEQGNKIHIGPGSYNMTWVTEVGQGRHDAKIVITQNTGEVIEYSWHFYIVNEYAANLAIIGFSLFILVAIVSIYFFRCNGRRRWDCTTTGRDSTTPS